MKNYTVSVFKDGTKCWYLNGKRHREDGPAIEFSTGTKAWYLNDQRHREDGPAIERAHRTKEWWLHGKLHREDGPAIEYADGAKSWYVNGKLHREDGPAFEFSNGDKAWFLNGQKLTEEEHKRRTSKGRGVMEEWEILIDLLEKSVAKNGEKPLTNKWLLNIMRLAEKRAYDEEKRSELEGHRFDIY